MCSAPSSSSSETQTTRSDAGTWLAQAATSCVLPLPAGPVTTVIRSGPSVGTCLTNRGRGTMNIGGSGMANLDASSGSSACAGAASEFLTTRSTVTSTSGVIKLPRGLGKSCHRTASSSLDDYCIARIG
jgi:hypothetical protein